MATHKPVQVDPKELKRAQDMWSSFTNLTKNAIVAIIAVVALLGLAFVQW